METETILIGSQEWMCYNLNVSTFRDGNEIFHASTEKEWEYASKHQWPAMCSYENNEILGTIYGKLYNFFAVTNINGLAPLGFNIPTINDWLLLANQLEGLEMAGKYLKSVDLWEYQDLKHQPTLFNGLPGGLRYTNGSFDLANSNAFWWTASEIDSSNSLGINLYYDDFLLLKRPYFKGNGFSVRCIKSNVPFLVE